MNTRADLASADATHSSGIDFAADPATGWESIDALVAGDNDPSDCRLARIRQRVDVLLAEMLSDDAQADDAAADDARADDVRADDVRADDVRADYAEADGAELDDCRADLPDDLSELVPAGRAELMAAPVSEEASDGFWGPTEPAEPKPAGGYQSKHRLAGPPKEPKPSDGHRGRPRHAAPSVSFGASLGARLSRGLTAVRLAGRIPAHAES